jgi:hypothetical protein
MATYRTPGGIRYESNISGTNDLMTSEEMLALMVAAAQAGMSYAQRISPVDTGEYVESFRVEGEIRGGPARNRAEARLVNDSDHAADVEWRNHGGERVLGRTVDAIEGRSA